MSNTLSPDVIAAINRVASTPLGRKYNRMARGRYHVSGKKLAAKEIAGESGGRRGAVSSAGARGFTQFMPATRAEYMRKYGVDAWAGPEQAIKAMELYQTHGGGVESYNPGMPGYAKYILSQKLSDATKRGLHSNGGFAASPSMQMPGTPDIMVPGQSFAPERDDLAKNLLLGGGLSMQKLLDYKVAKDRLKDVPSETIPGIRAPQMPQQSSTAGGGDGERGGGFTLAPTAMKPGTQLASIQKAALRHLSARVGTTLTVGTGTNHSRLTVNGNVSDHSDGHASDIPSSGNRLTRLGQQALIAFGMPRRKALQQRGGLFNLEWQGHRVQVIFNTMEGGNHYTHLHLGVR